MIDIVAATKLLKSLKYKLFLGHLQQEAAEFLSFTAATMYGKISRGELPVMKRGKRLYISRAELLEYLKDGREKSNAEIERNANVYLLNNKMELNNGK
ncbi:MAG: helix-turn-helix domain-containing protein [Candidatus Paceibacterota bacterium]|jgi:excisionase family DNA binding protein